MFTSTDSVCLNSSLLLFSLLSGEWVKRFWWKNCSSSNKWLRDTRQRAAGRSKFRLKVTSGVLGFLLWTEGKFPPSSNFRLEKLFLSPWWSSVCSSEVFPSWPKTLNRFPGHVEVMWPGPGSAASSWQSGHVMWVRLIKRAAAGVRPCERAYVQNGPGSGPGSGLVLAPVLVPPTAGSHAPHQIHLRCCRLIYVITVMWRETVLLAPEPSCLDFISVFPEVLKFWSSDPTREKLNYLAIRKSWVMNELQEESLHFFLKVSLNTTWNRKWRQLTSCLELQLQTIFVFMYLCIYKQTD